MKWPMVVALGWMSLGFQLRGAEKGGALRAETLFEEHCFECHGDGIKKGEFDLEGLLQARTGPERHGQWLKAWKIVRHGFMPPADADPLPAEARSAITRWMLEKQLGVDFQKPDPGRVTMRRLNRMEYEFTVTDIFGADFVGDGRLKEDPSASTAQLRDMLPPDDTAFGFDNIGDFQTVSPALLEKYFNLAEFVVDRAIWVDGPKPAQRQLSLGDLRVQKDSEKVEAKHQLLTRIEKPGRYRVAMQFRLGGWFDGSGSYELDFTAGGEPVSREVVESGGEKTYTLSREMDLPTGEVELAYSTKWLAENSKRKPSPLELRPRLWLIGPLDRDLIYPESHQRIFFQAETPADPALRKAYAHEIMKRVADRAFRRPVTDSVLDRLTSLVMSAPSFEKGVAQGLMAILVSPNFLFRTEFQPKPDEPTSVHPLDEFALASRLSYFLWLSLPDDELSGLASRGELRKNLAPQVKRMLADPKAARFFEDFTGQWLRTRNVLMTPISRVDDEINAIRGAMKRETDMLFEDIARNDRDLIELVTANYTFVDHDLARYYGLAAPKEPGFHRVDLPADSKRGGILTHASFLVSTSNPNRTSPVKRGLFVLENLLGIEPPPPPAAVASLDDAKANGEMPRTVREQLALHRADKSCAGCHAHFDPIGIALENYDLIGRWRTEERGEPIAPNETTVTGQRLTGVEDIKSYFAAHKLQFYQCVTEKLLTYALGRGLEPGDSLVVDQLAERLN
ncbi:MAG TPA: DUF1592 domain-containing protein, partial [Chthoniobacteraceae bacterium]|nr:DUF1592 domain-containing protein [Chthoniobacteraceae bacterium]